MTDKNKANPQASLKSSKFYDFQSNKTETQRLRLLERLQQAPANTFDLIRELGIARPGARICELRAQGHDIKTHLADAQDDQGRWHKKVALYYLTTLTRSTRVEE